MTLRQFTIDGKPKGKGRPRFARRGKFVSTYTDKGTKDYEDHIIDCYKKAYPNLEPFDGYIRMYITCYFPIVKSANKKDKVLMREKVLRPDKKPDLDNILKAIGDSLNQVAYIDDKQIVSIYAEKYYCTLPRVDVTIEQM